MLSTSVGTASRGLHTIAPWLLRTGLGLALLLGAINGIYAQYGARPPRGPEALNRAIELQRRGEYEQAAEQLDLAQAQAATLTSGEKNELANLTALNRSSMQSRKQARELLAQTEAALRQHNNSQAKQLCRKLVALETSLPAGERSRVGDIARTLGVSSVPLPGDSAYGADARQKLKEAREKMAQGDFDAAEKLVRIATLMPNDFTAKEDRPEKVLADLNKARNDPKLLLQASREALKAGDLDRAEDLATQAEQNAKGMRFPWSDNPGKVKKEIQALRVKNNPPQENATAEKPKTSGGILSPVKNMFARGKKEKQEKDEDPAKNWRSPAEKKEKQKNEQVAFKQQQPTPPTPPAPPAPTPENEKKKPVANTRIAASRVADTEAARKLLAEGRQALAKGDLEKARSCADDARAYKPNLDWHEDNPERLLRAVLAAQNKDTTVAKLPPVQATPVKKLEVPSTAAKTQAEATALTLEARQLLQAGKLDEAGEVLARARGFKGGKYGLFADSPDKVQADLGKARAKKDKDESARLLKEARQLYTTGEYEKARQMAFEAQRLHGPYNLWDVGDRPNKLVADIQAAEQKNLIAKRKSEPKSEDVAVKEPQPKPLPKPKTDVVVKQPTEASEKSQAKRLVAEAKVLQGRGKLLEANAKLIEARTLKVKFSDNEMSPETLQLELRGQAEQRIMQLSQEAMNLARFSGGDPKQNCEQSELALKEARRLALGFSMATEPIDMVLGLVAQQKARLGGAPTPVVDAGKPPVPTAPEGVSQAAYQRGLDLLEKSRQEMRRGQTTVARRLAEEAYVGPFGVKKFAADRLREIDQEDFNQEKMVIRRTFDAGVQKFNERSYQQAHLILNTIKPHQLDGERLARLKEIMSTPEMGGFKELVANSKLGDAKPPIAQVGGTQEGPKIGADSGDGRYTATDAPNENDLLKSFKQMREVKFQEVRKESHDVMREANDRFTAGDAQGAIDMLHTFLTKLPDSQLDAENTAKIRKPVESRLSRWKLMASQADLDRQTTNGVKRVADVVRTREEVERNKQKNVAQLMKQFNQYFKEGKYKEAEHYARMAKEVDPDNPVTTAAVQISRMQGRVNEAKKVKDEREEMFRVGILSAQREGKAPTDENPLIVDPARSQNAKNRINNSSITIGKPKSARTREIESKLDSPITVSFNDTPLNLVIEHIRADQSINIEADREALREEGIALDRPLSGNLSNIRLKSALDFLLKQQGLTWVIRDDILTITTPAHSKGKTEQKIYHVSDLVVPIEDHKAPEIFSVANQMQFLRDIQSPFKSVPQMPSPGGTGMNGGSHAGSPGGSSLGDGSVPTSMNGMHNLAQSGRGAPSAQLAQQLISLITNNISPETWNSQSGKGTIDYFPLGMTLIVNQTPDIQEQVADLLQQLRRLQDLEVAIEVRLISLSDNFFERMGVDFDAKIKTDRMTRRFEPDLVNFSNGVPLKPNGFIQDFSPSRLIAGITPAQTFTQDLDIPLTFSSFPLATPPFGLGSAFTGNITGGTSFGLAFLSDIQLFFFMEMAQGDQRFNVMQSPKLIMFNGQTATLSAGSTDTVVQGIAQGAQGQLFAGPVFLPIVVPQFQGINITLQPVISGDRRFVRLNAGFGLQDRVAQIPVFPVTVTVNQFLEGGGTQPPLVMTQFIQQPTTNFVSVNTTVVVPDGGTVLLGGLKRLAEGRNEFGPPFLSKIPYLNRLVKNVGYGRDTENILMIVTPRIIINEEEEILQTGVISSPSLVQE